MKVLVVLAHPSGSSFNASIAKTVIATLDELGCEVCFADLYRDGFDPCIDTSEISSRKIPEDARVAQYCDWVKNADGFVIVHPNWWGQPPAILKGWIDRVIRPDVAYRFKQGDSGEGVPVGLLKKNARALVINTTDTEYEREMEVFGDPLETIWKNCIFGFCGVNDFSRKSYGIVVTSTLRQRQEWLEDVAVLVKNKFTH